MEITHSIKIEYGDIAQILERVITPVTPDIVATIVVNTREKAIREALVQMGWTPPGTDTPEEGVDALRGTSPGPRRYTPEEALHLSRQHGTAEFRPVDSAKYWKERALRAERANSEASWALDNYRREAQLNRDREIGMMGGGG